MATIQAEGSLRLESLSGDLWDMARMVREFRADDQTIRRWVRERKLPGPMSPTRTAGPFGTRPTFDFFRRQRLRSHRGRNGRGRRVGDSDGLR